MSSMWRKVRSGTCPPLGARPYRKIGAGGPAARHLPHCRAMVVSGHRLEFGTTGFFPAFQGATIAKASEDLGFDVQMFSENHSMAADVFGEMRDAVAAT